MKHTRFALLTAVAGAAILTLPTRALTATKDAAKPVPATVAQQSILQPVASTQTMNEPDIMGVWQIYPDPFETPGFELDAPNGGPKLREPYARQWRAKREERKAKLKAGTPLVDRHTLCLPEGMPMIMGAIEPLQILQTPGQVIVLAEFGTQTRRILVNGKKMPPVEEVTPSHYGYSIGHWEGDTLVVETLGVREDTEYFEIPHSSEMKITERIRLTQPGYIENQITIDDPKILLEPYKFSYGYKRNDTYQITEYICEKVDPLLKFNADGTVEMKVD